VLPKLIAWRAAAVGRPPVPAPVVTWWLAVGAAATAAVHALVVPQVGAPACDALGTPGSCGVLIVGGVDSEAPGCSVYAPQPETGQMYTQLPKHRQTPSPPGAAPASNMNTSTRVQGFSWWGLLSGALWALSVTGRISAIGLLGLSIASGAADVVTAVAAFAYGAGWGGGGVRCGQLAAVGLALLGLALGSLWVLEAQARLRQWLLAELWGAKALGQGAAAGLALPGGGCELCAHESLLMDGENNSIGGIGGNGRRDGARLLHAPLLPHQQQGLAAPRGPASVQQEQEQEQEQEQVSCPLHTGLQGRPPVVTYAVGMAWACLAGVCSGAHAPEAADEQGKRVRTGCWYQQLSPSAADVAGFTPCPTARRVRADSC
jgi:hypothetical protein